MVKVTVDTNLLAKSNIEKISKLYKLRKANDALIDEDGSPKNEKDWDQEALHEYEHLLTYFAFLKDEQETYLNKQVADKVTKDTALYKSKIATLEKDLAKTRKINTDQEAQLHQVKFQAKQAEAQKITRPTNSNSEKAIAFDAVMAMYKDLRQQYKETNATDKLAAITELMIAAKKQSIKN